MSRCHQLVTIASDALCTALASLSTSQENSGELSFDQYLVCVPYLVADAFVLELCGGHINLKYNIVTHVPLPAPASHNKHIISAINFPHHQPQYI